MDKLSREIKNAYGSIELPRELREQALEKILDSAQKKGELTMIRTRKIKRPAAIVLIAAARAATVTAGAAINGIIHKQSVDSYLGEGAGDELESMGISTQYVTENGYFRITADAVLSDGDTAVIFVTKERLTEDGFGIVSGDNGLRDTVFPELRYENSDEVYDNENVTVSSDIGGENGRVSTDRYFVKNIGAQKTMVMTFKDAGSLYLPEDTGELETLSDDEFKALTDDVSHPYYLDGLSMTIDLGKNFEPAVFRSEEGMTVYLTPYGFSGGEELGFIRGHVFRLSAETGENITVNCSDYELDSTKDASHAVKGNFAELIEDFGSYDTLEIANESQSVVFYRQ